MKREAVDKPIQLFGGIKVKKDSDPDQVSNHLSKIVASVKEQVLVGKYLHSLKPTMVKKLSPEYVQILKYLAKFVDLKDILSIKIQ